MSKYKSALLILALALLSTFVYALQVKIKNKQYKRTHQAALALVTGKKAAEAVRSLKALLEKTPKDAETYYMLAVAQAKLGKLENAAEALQGALDSGLPPGRIIGGTRTGLEVLAETKIYKKLLTDHGNTAVHGPRLGCISHDGVKVWVRTAREADIEVIVSEKSDLSDPVGGVKGRSKKTEDFTAVLQVSGLEKNRPYHYGLGINGDKPERAGTFRTIQPPGNGLALRLAFGGGAGYTPQHERMWNTISDSKPDILLLLGDNIYSDAPQSPEMQHYCYYRRQSRPEFRKLTASTPVYTIWDDHDFGVNDCAYGPKIDSPAWKKPVWKVFSNNWVNPGYGTDKAPGCYYDFQLGEIHFIMLDGRFYRDKQTKKKKKEKEAKPKKNAPSMLGKQQKKWLLKTLRDSKATFRVLCSPVPWVFEAKGDSLDTWNGFKQERNEIFAFLEKEKIEGVILMSADRHRSDLWKIKREGTYPLWEFNSSRLTNIHVHSTMKAAEFSYNAKQSFGLVSFDTTLDDPAVTYAVRNIDGKEVFSKTLKRSTLAHK
ncbi:MAG: alkaline phosphatase D family protein [Planctomycetota bacterium]|nr:alkaline phosphatase D family protein [Planctomycetota bacterium]